MDVHFLWTAIYPFPMNTQEKERLALTGDASEMASGVRMKAARLTTGLGQEAFGQHGGIGKQAVNNVEKGRSFPSRPIMVYLFREHRIDFNFLILGQFSQLPGDVQDVLFEKLSDVHGERDLEPS